VTSTVRAAIRVEGVVQGVGFRPFVYSLATRLGLAGWVGNDVDGVFAEVEGPTASVQDFLESVQRDAPPLARVDRVTAEPMAPDGAAGFTIVASDSTGRRRALVSADSATCADCLRELADPADRRFGYPFINCTNCGPRFTIVRGVPYDRPLTTMAGFAMCALCAAEYHDPANRRFHAQPVCCPACGPQLRLVDAHGADLASAGLADGALAGAVQVLRHGHVLAVKGLGGYHLAADATSQAAAARLRARKHREDKPFAVMVPDVAAARELCELDDLAEELLTSSRRPIVVLPRRAARSSGARAGEDGQVAGLSGDPAGREGAAGLVADAVAPGNRQLGLMLPYTPLHHLLLQVFARPIVLTSGNLSDEPIAYQDADALDRLGGIADAFLTHDRPIHIRTDDSVVRPFRGREAVLRRSRGYVPEPLTVATRFGRPVLACGAELKNTFCLGREDRAFLSHHVGDLENYETLRSFTEGVGHFRRLFDVTPQIVAHDLHPDYLSTRYALEQDDCVLAGVQHHHAHIASCLADNGEAGPVIGIACDGLGYGTDGVLWGGEVMEVSLTGFRRLTHLEPVPLPGGATAIRQPWRTAAAWLRTAGVDPVGLPLVAAVGPVWTSVQRLLDSAVNLPVTTSVGRLFDAVAALVGIRYRVNYEGQAAIELEQCAAVDVTDGYPARLDGSLIRGGDLIRAVAADVRAGVDTPVVAARFHNGLADVLAAAAVRAAGDSGLDAVALSGGVFQNLRLLDGLSRRLDAAGLRVLTHSRVSCNDGGISLGQVAVAATQGALQ
jgi:hydrogenase maturation protein HypF